MEQNNASFRDKNINQNFICAFSEEYNNRLMWAHYSNEHKGFCIGYETKQMKNFLYKIEYVNKIFDITEDIIKIMNNNITKVNKPHKMVIQKDSIWKYEKEWRLINPISRDMLTSEFEKQGKDNNGYTYKLKPSIIYLGAKIEEKHKNALLEIAKTQNLTVNQMVMDQTNYNLSNITIYARI